MEDITSIKKRLQAYKQEDITYNEPHFTQQLILREGSKEEVIKMLLDPEHLVFFYTDKGKYGDTIYSLYFHVSNTKTMKIPVIFDKNEKKGLYILTYIMRHRKWQSMVKRN